MPIKTIKRLSIDNQPIPLLPSAGNSTDIRATTTSTSSAQIIPPLGAADVVVGRDDFVEQDGSRSSVDMPRPIFSSIDRIDFVGSELEDRLDRTRLESTLDESDAVLVMDEISSSPDLSAGISERQALYDSVIDSVDSVLDGLVKTAEIVDKVRDAADLQAGAQLVFDSISKYLEDYPSKYQSDVSTRQSSLSRVLNGFSDIGAVNSTSIFAALLNSCVMHGSTGFSTAPPTAKFQQFTAPLPTSDKAGDFLAVLASSDVTSYSGFNNARAVLPSDPSQRIILLLDALSYEMSTSLGLGRVGRSTMSALHDALVGDVSNVVLYSPDDGTIGSKLVTNSVFPLEVRDPQSTTKRTGLLSGWIDPHIKDSSFKFEQLDEFVTLLTESVGKYVDEVATARMLDDSSSSMSSPLFFRLLMTSIFGGLSSVIDSNGDTTLLDKNQLSLLALLFALETPGVVESAKKTRFDVFKLVSSGLIEEATVATTVNSPETPETTQVTKVSGKITFGDGVVDVPIESEIASTTTSTTVSVVDDTPSTPSVAMAVSGSGKKRSPTSSLDISLPSIATPTIDSGFSSSTVDRSTGTTGVVLKLFGIDVEDPTTVTTSLLNSLSNLFKVKEISERSSSKRSLRDGFFSKTLNVSRSLSGNHHDLLVADKSKSGIQGMTTQVSSQSKRTPHHHVPTLSSSSSRARRVGESRTFASDILGGTLSRSSTLSLSGKSPLVAKSSRTGLDVVKFSKRQSGSSLGSKSLGKDKLSDPFHASLPESSSSLFNVALNSVIDLCSAKNAVPLITDSLRSTFNSHISDVAGEFSFDFLTSKTANYSLGVDQLRFMIFEILVGVCGFIDGIALSRPSGLSKDDTTVAVDVDLSTLIKSLSFIASLSEFTGDPSSIEDTAGTGGSSKLLDTLTQCVNDEDIVRERLSSLTCFMDRLSSAVDELDSLIDNTSVVAMLSVLKSRKRNLSLETSQELTSQMKLRRELSVQDPLSPPLSARMTHAACDVARSLAVSNKSSLFENAFVATISSPPAAIERLRRAVGDFSDGDAVLREQEHIEAVVVKNDVMVSDIVFNPLFVRFCPRLHVVPQFTEAKSLSAVARDFVYMCYADGDWTACTLDAAVDFVESTSGLSTGLSTIVVMNHIVDAVCRCLLLITVGQSITPWSVSRSTYNSSDIAFISKAMSSSPLFAKLLGGASLGDVFRQSKASWTFNRFIDLADDVVPLTSLPLHRSLSQVVNDSLFTVNSLFDELMTPLDSEREYCVIFSHNDFSIDLSSTVSTSPGKGAYQALTSTGDITTKGGQIVLKDQRFSASEYAVSLSLVTN